ncbi:hypothetical protein K466DRAFT_265269 [Polyporus arcularius HHB13444]|uniref:C2H2-type domain-containing protein n=1 Tax=Polyporus arcularius HHB13444 TaxID=1314778 RepID=A0A5C3P106_9APHY|nr:hypothetical protein K466DRAFT_265269 [Polyporus arcularius HHB13444]
MRSMHSKDEASKYLYWCPVPGCNRSQKRGNKGFTQLCNMQTHRESRHLKAKHICPHFWLCQGVVIPCARELREASSLSRHRADLHNYRAHDPLTDVAIPTLCTASHCLPDSECGRAPAKGSDTGSGTGRSQDKGKGGGKGKGKGKHLVEEAFYQEEELLENAPFVDPFASNDAKCQKLASDDLPLWTSLPSSSYGVSCATTPDHVETFTSQLLSVSVPVEQHDQALYELQQNPLFTAFDSVLASLEPVPAASVSVPPSTCTIVRHLSLPQMHQGYPQASMQPGQFFGEQMAVVKPYPPSRESTVSPASAASPPRRAGSWPQTLYDFSPYRV